MKLRYNRVEARGLMVWAGLQGGEHWYQRRTFQTPFYSDQEVYRRALLLFGQRPARPVTIIGVTCYNLLPSDRSQLSLLEDSAAASRLTEAVDEVNARYGGFTITYAHALGIKKVVKQKLPFGSTKYFELLCGSR